MLTNLFFFTVILTVGVYCGFPIIPIVAVSGNYLLLNKNFVAFGAMLAFCEAVFFAACGNFGVDNLGVAESFDGFFFNVRSIALADTLAVSVFSAGCGNYYMPIAPVMAESGNNLLLNYGFTADFTM